MEYEAVIGLEIHAELLTASKIFCSCATAFGAPPNTQVCEVCLGMPGSLPVLNKKAVEYALKMALATNCHINPESVFARKNYFYPDLPKGYQISQYELPLAEHGHLDIRVNGEVRRIGITRIHMEEDAGKLIHSEHRPVSFVDFNRTGVPLIEIVSEPDMRTPEEAVEYFKGLRNILLYLEVCDGNMEEGSMKCDANISINLSGKGLGTKVEIKNMNSPRFVRMAMNYEIQRQRDCMEQGKPIYQETRLWNENRDTTETMRKKEEANDYRYFPEPDLPPFRPDASFLESVDSCLVEIPLALKHRLMRQYGLTVDQAEYIHDDRNTADFFEKAVGTGADPAQVYAWLSSDVKKILNRDNTTLEKSVLTPERLASLIGLIADGTVSGKIGKKVLDIVFEEDKDPEIIIREKGFTQITDRAALEKVIAGVLDDNRSVADAVTGGDERQIGWLVGQVMKATGGQAAPQLVQEILKEKIYG